MAVGGEVQDFALSVDWPRQTGPVHERGRFDEDWCRIRTGYGPEFTLRPRRFAIFVVRFQFPRCRLRTENAPANIRNAED